MFCENDTLMYIFEMDISDRLYEAMAYANFTSQGSLHAASGVPQPTISRILKGAHKKPEADTILKLANACQVNFEWLMNGSGVKERQKLNVVIEEEDNPETFKIRRVKFRVEAGITGYSMCQENEDGNPIYFRKDWLQSRGYKPEKLVAVYVHGESMEPGLFDGDTVIVNIADKEPRDGEVYAVHYESGTLIKRLVRDAGTWWLSSDNPDKRRFERKECSGDLCTIIGRVIHKQSERI